MCTCTQASEGLVGSTDRDDSYKVGGRVINRRNDWQLESRGQMQAVHVGMGLRKSKFKAASSNDFGKISWGKKS